jgi:hypothetical protein
MTSVMNAAAIRDQTLAAAAAALDWRLVAALTVVESQPIHRTRQQMLLQVRQLAAAHALELQVTAAAVAPAAGVRGG